VYIVSRRSQCSLFMAIILSMLCTCSVFAVSGTAASAAMINMAVSASVPITGAVTADDVTLQLDGAGCYRKKVSAATGLRGLKLEGCGTILEAMGPLMAHGLSRVYIGRNASYVSSAKLDVRGYAKYFGGVWSKTPRCYNSFDVGRFINDRHTSVSVKCDSFEAGDYPEFKYVVRLWVNGAVVAKRTVSFIIN
jgi:hypothetical protein